MKRQLAPDGGRSQRGSAAIELALILMMMFVLLFATLQFGRIFWQYNAVQKATHDAARFLALVPTSEMSDLTKATGARTLAQQIVVDAAAGAKIDPAITSPAVAVEFRCGVNSDAICTYSPNPAQQVTKVTVSVDVQFTDDFYFDFGEDWHAWIGQLDLTPQTTMYRPN
jgi:Flp pilus assembly protein TadG